MQSSAKCLSAIWKICLRDPLCCTLRTDLVEDFHRYLHSIEPSIQFILETESEGELTFLYVLICCNPDRFTDTTGTNNPHTEESNLIFFYPSLAHKAAMVLVCTPRHRPSHHHITRKQEEYTVSKAQAQINQSSLSQAPTITTILYIKGAAGCIR